LKEFPTSSSRWPTTPPGPFAQFALPDDALALFLKALIRFPVRIEIEPADQFR
jgi:hypothetical protein